MKEIVQRLYRQLLPLILLLMCLAMLTLFVMTAEFLEWPFGYAVVIVGSLVVHKFLTTPL